MKNQASNARLGTPLARWQKAVAPYQVPNLRRSLWQIVNTLIPYLILWVIMARTLEISYWLTLPLLILASGLAVRIFIIFHDCGHNSFFASRRANEVVGFITGVLIFTPYFNWRHEHAIHHASSGDLDRRGHGDIWMMTVAEYMAATPRERFVYRVYRYPLMLFLVGPLILFLILNRFPIKSRRQREIRSVYFTDLAIVGMAVGLSLLFGFWTYVILQLSILTIAAMVGVWLFYVQHQYEGVYWQHHEAWDYARAAVEGSSFYKLPKILQWFTGSIGYHHIHHLSPRIPNYNLQRCHDENPDFQIAPITLRESLGCLRFRLWDEEGNRLIGFSELQGMQLEPTG